MTENINTDKHPNINGVRSKHLADMLVSPNKPYIVKGMLLERQVSILAGPPNTGKSSVVGTILAHASQGKDLGTMRVKRSMVFYVGAEDPDGISSRTHGHFMDSEKKRGVEFYVHDEPIDMSNALARDDLISEMRRTKALADTDHLLIVFDTLTLSIGGLLPVSWTAT